jgi:hypothetical protein
MIKQTVATRLSKNESKRCPEYKISKRCPERYQLPQQPIFWLYSPAHSSWLLFPLLVALHAEHNPDFSLFPLQVLPYTLYQHKGFEPFLAVAKLLYRPKLLQAVLHHAGLLLLRRSIEGRQFRPQGYDACFHFFPLSVGLGPTGTWASGAFIIAPSILCHSQAIPSISSYSARPACHNLRKKPSFSQYMK